LPPGEDKRKDEEMIPKIRLWDKEEKRMVYYEEDCSAPDMTLNGVLISHDTQSNVSYKYESLLSTGLKDKNGKELFTVIDEKDSGDIVKYGYEDGTGQWQEVIGILEWDMEFQIALVVNTNGIRRRIVEADLANIELLGTTFENPELLEKE